MEKAMEDARKICIENDEIFNEDRWKDEFLIENPIPIIPEEVEDDIDNDIE
jgi:hypothetical protein